MLDTIENNKFFSKKTEPSWNKELVNLWSGSPKRNWNFYMAKSEFSFGQTAN
jgi:hypothetical protein